MTKLRSYLFCTCTLKTATLPALTSRAHVILRVPAAMLLLLWALLHGSVAEAQPGTSSLRLDVPFGDYVRRAYEVRDGLPSGWIEDLLQTQDGYLWMATRGGVVRFDGARFKNFPRSETPAIPSDFLRSLYETQDGTLYVVGEGGVARYSSGRPGTFARVEALTGTDATAVFEDSSGTLWVGTRGSTWFSSGGEHFQIDKDAPVRVRAFCEDRTGKLWLGTEVGLYLQNENGFVRTGQEVLGGPPNPNSFFPSIFVHALLADDDGSVWIGTRQGLMHYNNGRFEYRQEIGQAVVFDILRAQGGGLYIIADSSVIRWRGEDLNTDQIERHAVGGDQQPHIVAKCFTEDREGGFWVGREQSAGLFYYRNGPTSAVLQHRPHPANPLSPPVYIEEVRIDGRTVDAEHPFELLSGPRRLAIDFSAPTFFSPEGMQIKYRLDSHDENWVEARGERIAYYTDLGPGAYEFRVIAHNGNRVWNEKGQSIVFTVNPRWWETNLFRASSLLGVLALGISYFRSRTRRVRRMNATLRREIAQRKRAEATSRRDREQLARVSRASSMGELTTSIAQQIKQPLFAISSNAQSAERLLSRDPPDMAEVYETLDDIASDGNRASSIIEHVRSMVRKDPPPTKLLDLNQVARQVIRLTDLEVAERGLSIKTDFTEGLPPVMGNSVELQQVILNLIINGLQAMSDVAPGSRELRLTTSSDDDSVQLTVVDHGVGLDEEQARHVFDPFFTTKSQRTGMGLAINRTIIEAHGGRIWATSNEDRGATFHFRLPAITEEAT